MAANSLVHAFTIDQVSRLTGLSRRQLESWDRDGFFTPSLASENRRRPLSRICPLQDVMSLRVLNTLRNDLKISLPHLKAVKEKCSELGQDAWHRVTLYVVKRKVVFYEPEMGSEGTMREIVDGQGVLQIPLESVHEITRKLVSSLLNCERDDIGQLSKDRGVVHNTKVVKGTRGPVTAIRSLAEDGYSKDDIVDQYPMLKRQDVEAALSGQAAA